MLEDLKNHPDFDKSLPLPGIFRNESTEARASVDYIITLGGDGTVLWASKQFNKEYFPPVIAFAMGSLGYMCNFDFARCHEKVLSKLMTGMKPKMDTRLRLRMGLDGAPVKRIYTGATEDNYTDVPVENIHCLNEILISRGPSPYPVDLELYIDGIHVTSMIGDGLIIATPNGSTAYNVSAGGSIVMDSCQCYCITPLAPHSLSFRPLIVPTTAKVTVKPSPESRIKAWVALDGATRFELDSNDAIQIDAQQDSSISMVTRQDDNLVGRWNDRIHEKLGWNSK